jgi:multisubunit Na+/H+ antiporter MnhF subunit
MTTDSLAGIRREVWREVHRDGLTEIVAGVALFIIALATGRPAFYWTFLVLILLLSRGLVWLRSRYTYPRIGYAELPRPNGRRLGWGMAAWFLAVFAAIAVALALVGRIGDHLAWRQAAPALGGLLLAGGLLDLARRTGLRRVFGLAAASVVIGVVLALQEIEGAYANLRVWALVMALLCFGVGGLAFRRFLRETPQVEGAGRNVD